MAAVAVEETKARLAVCAMGRGKYELEIHAGMCPDWPKKIHTMASPPYLQSFTSPEAAVLDYWADFLPDGCAYEEGGPGTGMDEASALATAHILPCAYALFAFPTSLKPAAGVDSGPKARSSRTATPKEPTMATSTTTKTRPAPARRGAAKPAAAAAPAPSRRGATSTDKDLLNGLTGDTKGAVGRPAPKPARTPAAKPATATPKPASPAKAKPAAKPAPAATEEPKIGKAESKQDLARRVILAIGAEVMASDGSEAWAANLSADEALDLCAQWLHYLPVGRTWPEGPVPVPARSEWNEDGTRV